MARMGRYLLKTHVEFAAAHQLRGYDGDCARLHGHNYRVEVEVLASRLDKLGLGLDFRKIRGETEKVAAELDHRFLNEIEPFDRINPTAENIASYFYERLRLTLCGPSVALRAVTIHETGRYSVRYTEEEGKAE